MALSGAPPLVRYLVGRHEESIIGFIRVSEVANPAKLFGIRNRIGKRLCVASIARKFQDAHLPVLVRREVPVEVIHPCWL